jgi:hypothetical protein
MVAAYAFAAQYPREAARLKMIGPAEMVALGLDDARYEHHAMATAVDELRAEVADMAAAAVRAEP